MRATALALSVLIISPAWAAGPPFAEFPAGPVAQGPSVPPDLSAPNAKAFRTRLREGVRGPANFAGHYSLVRWGCGTSCSQGAVVDRLNGHVIMLPSVCCTEHWTETLEPIDARPNSRLLVLSGKINEEGPDVVHYYVLDGSEVHEARSVPFPDAAPAARASTSSVTDCKGIVSAVARLDCYDRANGRQTAHRATWITRRVATLEPGSLEDLATWPAIVNEHALRQDTLVTLAMALAHVGGMLAERLPA